MCSIRRSNEKAVPGATRGEVEAAKRVGVSLAYPDHPKADVCPTRDASLPSISRDAQFRRSPRLGAFRVETRDCPAPATLDHRVVSRCFCLPREVIQTSVGHAQPEYVRNGTLAFRGTCYAGGMSARNGDRARFHKDRKRKLHHRQRIQALMAALRKRADEKASARVASLNMPDEGAPARIGD
jgi:hypothetical protein